MESSEVWNLSALQWAAIAAVAALLYDALTLGLLWVGRSQLKSLREQLEQDRQTAADSNAALREQLTLSAAANEAHFALLRQQIEGNRVGTEKQLDAMDRARLASVRGVVVPRSAAIVSDPTDGSWICEVEVENLGPGPVLDTRILLWWTKRTPDSKDVEYLARAVAAGNPPDGAAVWRAPLAPGERKTLLTFASAGPGGPPKLATFEPVGYALIWGVETIGVDGSTFVTPEKTPDGHWQSNHLLLLADRKD